MKTIRNAMSILCVVAAASIAIGVSHKRKMSHPESRVAPTPVLVELFTSEGCSSCPPADRLLAGMQKAQPAEGALVIPLSEHVDYWDGPAWRDPFSSPQFSARQGAYVKALNVQGPYTPQMVVDGQFEFLGSDEQTALQAVTRAAEARKDKVEVSAKLSNPDVAAVNVSIRNASGARSDSPSDVYVAVAENNLDSQVRGGENGGRHLNHTAVLRMLKRVGTLQPGEPFLGTFELGLNTRWKRKDIAVVAFIQSRTSRRIQGVGSAGLSIP